MKQFSILQGKAHVVELPEVAHSPVVTTSGRIGYIDNDLSRYVQLPPGTWEIVGLLPEVTEETADQLVEHDWQWSVKIYRNYQTTSMAYYDEQITALESLESAILAEGYAFQSTPKPENKDFYWGYLDDLAKWEQAQSLVLCRERCLVLRRIDL